MLLLSLATVRRFNEIHALSGFPADTFYSRRGNLKFSFLPEFPVKNQLPDAESPSPVVKSFPSRLCAPSGLSNPILNGPPLSGVIGVGFPLEATTLVMTLIFTSPH